MEKMGIGPGRLGWSVSLQKEPQSDEAADVSKQDERVVLKVRI